MKNNSYSQNDQIQEAMKLAQSPQGQALYNQLQEQHGQLLESVIAQAQAGNFDQIKQSLSGLLNSAEGRALMQQLQGDKHG